MLKAYVLYRRGSLATGAVILGLFVLMAWLYAIPVGAVIYIALLSMAVGATAFGFGYAAFARRCRGIEELLPCPTDRFPRMPEGGSRLEQAYQAMVLALCEARDREAGAARTARLDMEDYYGLWAHQIKTPLAAMHLLLRAPEGPDTEAIDAELFKTEQYVEMVLNYLRLGADETDFVLRRQPLDGLVRGCVRKFARLFILKKITLHFTSTDMTVLTDEKWFSFIVEQVLSNALKYTPAGGEIWVGPEEGCLCIRDNGIGIRAEDLPRIMEKGYTGWNGREDKQATGLGLYLCGRAAEKLNMDIRVRSAPGKGTAVYLSLCTEEPLYE